MKEIKNILFTFDYELFLGAKSGTVSDCLIEPTEKILNILEPYKIKGVFFVDTTYLILLKKAALKDTLAGADLNLIFIQLRKLIEQGHYVFAHIHPHWLDAIYLPEAREWLLPDLSKYRFHNLDDMQKKYLFEESINMLQEIIFAINPDYVINAYRAGGWSIEPFSDFKPFFERFNIRYDFSVLPGKVEFSTARYFDYSDIPIVRSIYHFQDDVKKENNNGSFVEFCVSVLPVNKTLNFLNKIWLRIACKNNVTKNYERGLGAVSKPLFMLKKSNLKNNSYEVASIELMTPVLLPLYISFLKKNSYMHIASHTKIVTGHNLYRFRKFLENIYGRYEIETDFYKML